MATASMALQVNTQQEMESMIQGYIAQGFNIANRTPTSVTLIKRKEFSVLWAVIGFLICVLPLLIYLIIYAAQSDQMVTITLAGAQPATGYGATPAIASPAAVPSNPGYQLSPDGQYFWDGQQWRPVAQLPAQTGPLPGQSGPLYGQSGPLTDQPAAGYPPAAGYQPEPQQQPQQTDSSAGYYSQQQPQQQADQQQQPGTNQGQPGQSGPLYGQGQGNYPTYPGSGGSGQ